MFPETAAEADAAGADEDDAAGSCVARLTLSRKRSVPPLDESICCLAVRHVIHEPAANCRFLPDPQKERVSRNAMDVCLWPEPGRRGYLLSGSASIMNEIRDSRLECELIATSIEGPIRSSCEAWPLLVGVLRAPQ